MASGRHTPGLPQDKFKNLCNSIEALTDSVLGHVDTLGRLGDTSLVVSGGMSSSDLLTIYDEEIDVFHSWQSHYMRGYKTLLNLRAKLTAQRNAHAPVNKLPEEILCMIFAQCRDLLLVKTSPSLRRPPTVYPVIPISQTCNLWRKLCLTNPSLWNSITLHTRSLNLILDRGRPLPLKYVYIPKPTSRRAVDVLRTKDFSRVEALDLEVPLSLFFPLDGDESPGTFTNLQRLSLDTRELAVRIFIPKNVKLHGYVPQLRHLDFYHARWPWSQGYYPSKLTTLRIAGCPVGPSDTADQDICWVLKDLPELEFLELELTRPSGWRAESDRLLTSARLPRISMKSLSTMKLDMPVAYAKHILSNVDTSSVTTLVLKLRSEEDQLPGLDPAIAPLILPGVMPPSIFAGTQSLVARAMTGEGWSSLLCFGSDGEVLLNMSWSNRKQEANLSTFNWIANIIHANYQLPRLSHVTLYSDVEILTGPHPLTQFATFPTITALRLIDIGAAYVLSDMALERFPTGANGWPNLTSIQVRPFLEPKDTKALLELCSRCPKLCVIDLSDSVIQGTSLDALVEFFGELLAKTIIDVDLTDTDLEDLSTFDAWSSVPELVAAFKAKSESVANSAEDHVEATAVCTTEQS